MTGTTTRVSWTSDGRPFSFRPGSPSISADGRYIAFVAPLFYPENQQASQVTKSRNSVVVRDTVTNTTTLVSVPIGSSPLADSGSVGFVEDNGNVAISANGRYVVFASDSPNLVPNDTNFSLDFFVRDLATNTTTLVSVDSNGNQAQYARGNNNLVFGAGGVAISADGRYIAFATNATNLVPNDTNGETDVFVRDLVTGTTERISTDSQGNQMPYPSHSVRPAISADGRYVAFKSIDDLVPGDTNLDFDIYVKDRLTGLTTRVSTASNGNQGVQTQDFELGSAGVGSPAISADGRYVAFQSRFSNLVANDTNGYNDIFVKDRLTGITTRVSTDSSGNQANDRSTDAAISADGRYVAFSSKASNLVPGDMLGAPDVFVKDLLTGTTTRVSVNSQGVQAMDGFLGTKSFTPVISADGRFIAFASNGANLVSDGFDTNTDQLFLHDTRPTEPRPGTGNNSGNPNGGAGNDTLTGGTGNQPIDAGAGDDLLIAGKGRQTLTGGPGRDRFIFKRLDAQPDRITDFELKKDKIVLTELIDRITPRRYKGNPIADDYLRFSRRGANTLISLDQNGKRRGGWQTLVIFEDVAIGQLKNRNNFVF